MQNINDETLHDNPLELLDEDIVKAAPSCNLIDRKKNRSNTGNFMQIINIL